jgi:peroxiredoxin (alkyl hydroperoxide reductase subunit C)
MVMPGESKTETSRCVFVIDPKSIVRAMIYYPLTTGRNMKEIVRLIDALQTADANQVATPANWEPGQKVIIPAPKTTEELEQRVEAGYECADWYLCMKPLGSGVVEGTQGARIGAAV